MGKQRLCALRRVSCTLAILAAVFLLLPQVSLAWSWGSDPLLTVNGADYTADDYRQWWGHWREKDTPLPESPDEYVDWLLMVQQGEQMELYQEPSYVRKVQTFLKVRSLMLLKKEEIDEKVKIPESEIRAHYEKEYNPRWHLMAFLFKEEEQARKQAERLVGKEVTTEELAKLTLEQGGPLSHLKRWQRLPKFRFEWRDYLGESPQAGAVSTPISQPNGFLILVLLEIQGPESEDYQAVKRTIESGLYKEKHQKHTVRFVEELKKRYQLRIDEKILARLGEERPDEELAKQIVIATKKQNIDAMTVWDNVQRDLNYRRNLGIKDLKFADLKESVMANIISQTLVSWEALERHYEKEEPFKNIYNFYTNHRLTKEIEKRFVQPKAKVNKEDMLSYYKEHKERYTHPEMISYAMADGEKSLVKKIRESIVHGKDFFEAVSSVYPEGAETRQLPINHLKPQLAEALKGLKTGEVSVPFKYGEGMALVKLISRKKAVPVPFEKVKQEIGEKVQKQKYEQAKKEFVEMLRSRSQISVAQEEWVRLQKELREKDASKKNS